MTFDRIERRADERVVDRPARPAPDPALNPQLLSAVGNRAMTSYLEARGPVIQRMLYIGSGHAQRRIDLERIDGLVQELMPDPSLRRIAGKDDAERRDLIRDAVLLFCRDDRRFADRDELAAAVEARLRENAAVAKVDWTADEATIARTHPERRYFVNALTDVLDPTAIDELWDLTVRGIKEQARIGEHATQNQYYSKLAARFRWLLKVKPEERLAVWSGGYAVSMYAQARGFKTLETTQAGKVYDRLKLFKDFSLLGELWNSLAREFMQQCGEIHVFLRTSDPSSVAFEEELPALMKLNSVANFRWHLLRGKELAELKEVDDSGEETASFAFDSYSELERHLDRKSFRNDALRRETRRHLEDEITSLALSFHLDQQDPKVAAKLEKILESAMGKLDEGEQEEAVRRSAEIEVERFAQSRR